MAINCKKYYPFLFTVKALHEFFSIWLRALELYYKSPSQKEVTNVILIDEIDNGLHYSIKPMIWDLIFKIAVDFNIQFFITTHDEEFFCSLFDLKDVKKYKDLFQFIRSSENQIVAYYDFEMLKLIAEKNLLNKYGKLEAKKTLTQDDNFEKVKKILIIEDAV